MLLSSTATSPAAEKARHNDRGAVLTLKIIALLRRPSSCVDVQFRHAANEVVFAF